MYELAFCFASAYTLYCKVNRESDAMRDLDKALADILAIRNQIAAGTAFRGYGPAGSYGNKPEPIPFLRILAVSDGEDLRGEHRPLT